MGGQRPAAPVHLPGPAARREARRADRGDRGDGPRARDRPQAGPAVLRPPEGPGPDDPAGRRRAGLPRARPRAQEQPRADQGRRPGDHDDGVGAADRGHRGPGPRRPEAGARPDHRAQHDDREPHRQHLADAARPVGARSTSRPCRRRSGIDKLQAAFANIYATMDEIDTFKLKALDNMATTVTALEGELTKAQTYLDRARGAGDPGADAGGDLTLR